MIKAIFFDFDGVLAESVSIKTEAFRALFQNQPEHIRDKIIAYHLKNGGMSRFKKFDYYYEHFIKKPLDEATREELGRKFSSIVFEKTVTCPAVEGAKAFLSTEYKRRQLFVVSGTPEAELRDIVQARGWADYFIEVLGSPKSKAACVNFLLQKYQLKSTETVFVGDAINDLEGATLNFVPFIARMHRENAYLKSATPKINFMIHDLTELSACLERLELSRYKQ